MFMAPYTTKWYLLILFLVIFNSTFSFAAIKTFDTTSLLKSKNVMSLNKFLSKISINSSILKNFAIAQTDNVSYANSNDFKSALSELSNTYDLDSVALESNVPLSYIKKLMLKLKNSEALDYFLDSYNNLYILGEDKTVGILNLNDPIITSQINFKDLISELSTAFEYDNLDICLNNLENLVKVNELPLEFSSNLTLVQRYNLIETLLNVLIEKYEKVKNYDSQFIDPKLKFLKQNKEYIIMNLLKPKLQDKSFNFVKFNELYDSFRYAAYLQLKGTGSIDATLKNLSKLEFMAVYNLQKYPTQQNIAALNQLPRGTLILDELKNKKDLKNFNYFLNDVDILTNLQFELSDNAPYSTVSLYDRLKAKVQVWFISQPLYMVILKIVVLVIVAYVAIIIIVRLTIFILDLIKKYTLISKSLTSITLNISQISKLIDKIGIDTIISFSVAVLLSIIFCIIWIIINAGRGKKYDF